MRGKTHEEIVNFQAQSFYVVFVHMNILHPILRDITLHEEKKLLKSLNVASMGNRFPTINAAKDPSQFTLLVLHANRLRQVKIKQISHPTIQKSLRKNDWEGPCPIWREHKD